MTPHRLCAAAATAGSWDAATSRNGSPLPQQLAEKTLKCHLRDVRGLDQTFAMNPWETQNSHWTVRTFLYFLLRRVHWQLRGGNIRK